MYTEQYSANMLRLLYDDCSLLSNKNTNWFFVYASFESQISYLIIKDY